MIRMSSSLLHPSKSTIFEFEQLIVFLQAEQVPSRCWSHWSTKVALAYRESKVCPSSVMVEWMLSSVEARDSFEDLKSAERADLCSSSSELMSAMVMLAVDENSLSFSVCFLLALDKVGCSIQLSRVQQLDFCWQGLLSKKSLCHLMHPGSHLSVVMGKPNADFPYKDHPFCELTQLVRLRNWDSHVWHLS